MDNKKLFVYAPTKELFEQARANDIADADAIAFIGNPKAIWA